MRYKYPTPRCHDAQIPSKSEFDRTGPCLAAIVWRDGGFKNTKEWFLNPDWAENYLMCMPTGWSNVLKPLKEENFIIWKDFCIEKLNSPNNKDWIKETSPTETQDDINRKKRMKCIGNAQVSVVAAYAFKELLNTLDFYENTL